MDSLKVGGACMEPQAKRLYGSSTSTHTVGAKRKTTAGSTTSVVSSRNPLAIVGILGKEAGASAPLLTSVDVRRSTFNWALHTVQHTRNERRGNGDDEIVFKMLCAA